MMIKEKFMIWVVKRLLINMNNNKIKVVSKVLVVLVDSIFQISLVVVMVLVEIKVGLDLILVVVMIVGLVDSKIWVHFLVVDKDKEVVVEEDVNNFNKIMILLKVKKLIYKNVKILLNYKKVLHPILKI